MAGFTMTRDVDITLAHEADCLDEQHYGHAWVEKLKRFAALVRMNEREACAKVCDHMASRCNDIRAAALEVAAESIRARGQE